MTRAAAFFDLDKTILATSSALAFARPFYRGGLIGRSDVIRSAYAQFIFLASGADHDQMETMRRYMSDLVKGWDVAKVREIVAETIDVIIDPAVYDEAVALIEEHRAAGRDIVIISSSGTEVVEPIGERLGADVAIGTQLVVDHHRPRKPPWQRIQRRAPAIPLVGPKPRPRQGQDQKWAARAC